MESKLADDTLPRLGEFVSRTLGLHFTPERYRDLERGIAGAAVELEMPNGAALSRLLLNGSSTRQHIAVLASHLTVGETYFFRENAHFEFLAKQILPALIRERQDNSRHLRIWCAACCSGEEPYSLAILLRRMIPDCHQWNLMLLATDINPRFLAKAECGIYGQWSFRKAPPWLKDQYFQERGAGHFELLPEIRGMVRFERLNLIEDVYPSLSNDTNGMDIIFCRNVLMYFDGENAHRVIRKLHRSQVENGWLFVGPSELLHVSASPYLMVKAPGAILYQKSTSRPQVAVHPVQRADEVFHPSLVTLAPRPAINLKNGNAIPAADQREKFIPVGSEISDQLYANAVILYEQGRYSDALEKLAAMPSNLPHGPVLRLRARCFANQGRLSEALACCDEWIAADKLNASAHYLRSAILQEQHSTEEAARSLRKTVYLDNGFVLAHFALGNIARRAGRDGEAGRHFENVRRLLCGRRAGEILAESEGLSAGRLLEMLDSFSVAVEAQ